MTYNLPRQSFSLILNDFNCAFTGIFVKYLHETLYTSAKDPARQGYFLSTFWTRNWSPNAANLLVVVVVVRGRRSLKKP